ncbi:A-kinase anchor protein inhibitor 1 isoform X1 [Phocoena sinus]|uniref:A-kinase anchor protein inhibitor 1 isoform X1 n=1 Tax=Phocoena sinus TaxID=42100 RepID=UPI0013C3F22A|nr:A-kinase anchor protein inhibitor 1 isoform X1 [Phocoena sinus]
MFSETLSFFANARGAPASCYTGCAPASSTLTGEKPGSESEEAKLQIASKQIVQNAILRAVQQVSRESRQREAGAGDTPRGSFRPGAGELTKKHEKK